MYDMAKVLVLPKLKALQCSHCRERIYYLDVACDDELAIGQAIEVALFCPLCSECIYSVIIQLDEDETLIMDAVKLFPDEADNKGDGHGG